MKLETVQMYLMTFIESKVADKINKIELYK